MSKKISNKFHTKQGGTLLLTPYESETTGEVRYLTSFSTRTKGKTVTKPITDMQWCNGFKIEKFSEGNKLRSFLVLTRGGVESRHFELKSQPKSKK